MRDRSIVPTNLLNWPRCRALLPEQKLILIYLWASPDLSCCGAGLIPLAPVAATLGFSEQALETGLENLRDAGLLSLDKESGEIFIKDWFRFHTFKNEKALQILDSAIKKIESSIIKRAVTMEKNKLINSAEDVTNTPKLPKKSSTKETPTKSTTCLPTTTSTATLTLTNNQQEPAAASAAAGGAFCKDLVEAAKRLGLNESSLKANAQGATNEQLQILLQLYQSPPPDVRNPTGFAIWQARRAAAGQLPATLTPAEDKSSSTLSDEDKKRIEQQAQLQKLANEKEFAKIAALNAARRKVTHINELLSLR